MESLMSSTRAVVISTLAIFMLMLVPPEPSSAAPSPSNSHPLCVSQYALVSQSCAQYFLRRDNEEDGVKHIHDHEHDDDHEHDEDHEHEQKREHEHEEHRHEGHENEHHEENRNRERNEGGRQRRGRRRGENENREGEPDEEDCCRWLEEMDDECVCDLLIRLPPFLTKAPHNYSVSIGEECSVSYTCGETD